MAETVWTGSRERFLVLFGNGSNRIREWGLLGRDSPEREQREVPGPVQIYRSVPGTGAKWENSQFRPFLKQSFTFTYIYI